MQFALELADAIGFIIGAVLFVLFWLIVIAAGLFIAYIAGIFLFTVIGEFLAHNYSWR